ATGRESQVSVQHAVAAALVHGAAGIDQFTDACVADPRVEALRAKVEVLRGEAISTIPASLDIPTPARAGYYLMQSPPPGRDANPMSDADLEQKLRTVAKGWNPRHDMTPLIDAIWTLDASKDVSRLAALAVPR